MARLAALTLFAVIVLAAGARSAGAGRRRQLRFSGGGGGGGGGDDGGGGGGGFGTAATLSGDRDIAEHEMRVEERHEPRQARDVQQRHVVGVGDPLQPLRVVERDRQQLALDLGDRALDRAVADRQAIGAADDLAEHRNGEEWYDVHPLVRDEVRELAATAAAPERRQASDPPGT